MNGQPPSRELKDAREFCNFFARVNARHFYYAFRIMPREQRWSLMAIYAFCQKADQLMDLEPDPEEKRARLADRRQDLALLAACLAGEAERPQDPILLSLLDTLERQPIPLELFHSLLDGLEMDLETTRYSSMEQLETYCWHVAGVVGRMVVASLGGDPERLNPYADRLGLAMQLTNIARDVREDLREGRVYLPADWLKRHGVGMEGFAAEHFSPELRNLLKELCARADSLYDEADQMLRGPDRRLMKVARVMAGLYRPILCELRARDYDVFQGKVGYPIWKKLLIALRIVLQ